MTVEQKPNQPVTPIILAIFLHDELMIKGSCNLDMLKMVLKQIPEEQPIRKELLSALGKSKMPKID